MKSQRRAIPPVADRPWQAVARLVDELALPRSPFGLLVYVTACQSVPFSLDANRFPPMIDSPNAASGPGDRHGCLTTYLVFVIIVNSAMTLMYVFGSEWLRRNGAKTPDWAFWALALAGLVNVISAVALFRWKRWGFWLFVASALAGLAVNLSIGLPQGIFGAIFGIAILYGVLHIGKERKAWPRLR